MSVAKERFLIKKNVRLLVQRGEDAQSARDRRGLVEANALTQRSLGLILTTFFTLLARAAGA
jgi:hypothetical protein